MTFSEITALLGDEAGYLLDHECQKIPRNMITQPSKDHVKAVFSQSDRSKTVQHNLKRLYGQGRLGGTGYLSVFPVDQGVEHTAGYSFAQNPAYFNPETIVEMACEAEMSGVASTLGILGLLSGRYARKIPFIVKLNHNQVLTPGNSDQTLFASVKQAHELGAVGVGATIYFGSEQANRQISEISEAFAQAHELGMFTMLWCYPRNPDFTTRGTNHETSADITGQANYLGVTIGADIIKQKLPTHSAQTFKTLDFGKHRDEQYDQLLSDHPVDWVRYQVLNCYAGKISLINSGGASSGDDDLQAAVRTAVINKRGGGAGLIMGRKVFNRPFDKGVALVRAVQDVYLAPEISIA